MNRYLSLLGLSAISMSLAADGLFEYTTEAVCTTESVPALHQIALVLISFLIFIMVHKKLKLNGHNQPMALILAGAASLLIVTASQKFFTDVYALDITNPCETSQVIPQPVTNNWDIKIVNKTGHTIKSGYTLTPPSCSSGYNNLSCDGSNIENDGSCSIECDSGPN